MDNLEIGAHAGLSYADGDRSDCTSYALAPFVTYHLPVNEKSNFYLTGRVGFAKSECDYDRYSSDGDGTLWSVGAGWEYFFNRHVASNIGLEYTDTDYDVEYDGNVNNGESTNLSSTAYGLNIGLKIYF
jgi:opacity protein-like surface antigen